jgi:hypothetical protein
MTNIIFRRDLRRHLRAPIPWVVATLLALLLPVAGLGLATTVAILMSLGALSAWWFAYRSLRSEVDHDTIESLASLPIPLTSVLLQVAGGAAVAACIPWTTAALVWILCAGTQTVGPLAVGLAIVASLAGMGACMALHQDRGLAEKIANGVGFALASLVAVKLIATSIRYPDGDLRWALVSLAAGAGVGLASAAWWRVTGGHWPESMLPVEEGARSRPGTVVEHPLYLMVRTPDGRCPVLWRELTWGCTWGVKITAVTLAAFWMGLLSSGVRELSMGLIDVLYLGAVPGTVLITALSAIRSSSERMAGMWIDLAPTPISAARIVSARVGGTSCAAGLWLVSVLLVCCKKLGPELGTVGSVCSVVLLVLLWVFASLAGISAGTAMSGGVAILAGLAFVAAGCYCVQCVIPALAAASASGGSAVAAAGAAPYVVACAASLAGIGVLWYAAVSQLRRRGADA